MGEPPGGLAQGNDSEESHLSLQKGNVESSIIHFYSIFVRRNCDIYVGYMSQNLLTFSVKYSPYNQIKSCKTL